MPNRGINGSLSSIPVEMGNCGMAYADKRLVTQYHNGVFLWLIILEKGFSISSFL